MWNVANVLTITRLAAVLVFVYTLVLAKTDESTESLWRWIAVCVFLMALATDYADGYLARQRRLITAFGKLADPIADKVLTGAAWIGLSVWGLIPWWATIVILVREVGVTVLRLMVAQRTVISANWGGKLKTVLQGLTIAWYLAPWGEPMSSFAPFLLGVTIVVTLVTGGQIFLRGLFRKVPS